MTAKRVLYAVTKGNWGGAQRYVFDLAINLPKNFTPVVLCGEGDVLKQKLAAAGIFVVELKKMGRDIKFLGDLKNFFAVCKIIKQIKPDILHLNSPKMGGLGALAGRLYRVPLIIFTSHGWPFWEDRPAWQTWLLKILSWFTILLSYKTIVISQREKEAVERWPGVTPKLALIYHGIKPPKLTSQQEARKFLAQQALIALPKPAVWLGSIAELHRNKGLNYLLEAVAKLEKEYEKNFVLFIIGEGEERKRLESLTREKRLNDRVFLTGFLDEASKYLSAFDIFVLPSIKEGLPYTLLEAGAAGLAVVASHVGGIPEIIEEEKCGLLIQPKNTEELAEKLRKLLSEPAKRAKFSQVLKERVTQVFNQETMLQNTWIIYNEK